MQEEIMETHVEQVPVEKTVDVVIRDKDTHQVWATYGDWNDANADKPSWERRYPNAEAAEVARS